MTRNIYDKERYQALTARVMADMPEGMRLQVRTFDELTTDELYALLHTRSQVFVVEQDCVYQDVDYHDQKAIHLWIDYEGQTVAQCRICPAGTKLLHLSIGRVVTIVRGRGFGALIMRKAIALAHSLFPAERGIFIESQATKQGFYEKLGFRATSESFMMEGLLHLNMWLDFK
ncbi:MAG: GNAT family N-acetyltransferase [Bacteroidaceae bacterium]